MKNQFAETIAKVQEIAGFDSVAQAMQFATTPAFIEIGTMQYDIWQAEKKQFFKTLFRDNPLAACLCYALAQSMLEASYINDFSEVYENNKDEYFARWFGIFLEDYSMIKDCGYFYGGTNIDVDHDQLFDLIGKDIRKFARGETIALRPLYDHVDTLEYRRLEALRMDAQYMAKLAMQEGNDFYSANSIANALGIFDGSSKEYALIKHYVWQIYNQYKFTIVNNVTTNVESV